MTAGPDDTLTILHLTERLLRDYPDAGEEAVRRAVATAYAEHRYARVRTYMPVLMERRARDLLAAAQEG
ncbi:hypothetical protein OOK31_16645 [Streptomyces sp. NBC_00249]|uniref:three-helix bundle dimerization domain-containing protein n=1 Tax=Streptomyces sp. NBC_00249 TaxID=2975690 RepID=UPI0022548D85|nr:hypothetical protein [Streptomyces sp. NBC_00249]MCX5195514.1 hypothetical protein [Streptomyces sp. NBC_00249]